MTKPRQILGDPIGLVERLDDEYIKMLQSMDPHKPEYVERLVASHSIYISISPFTLLSLSPFRHFFFSVQPARRDGHLQPDLRLREVC